MTKKPVLEHLYATLLENKALRYSLTLWKKKWRAWKNALAEKKHVEHTDKTFPFC